MNLVYDHSPHEILHTCSSVVRASDRCTEGHGFDSRWGLRFFSLSHAYDKLNTVYLTMLCNVVQCPKPGSNKTESC